MKVRFKVRVKCEGRVLAAHGNFDSARVLYTVGSVSVDEVWDRRGFFVAMPLAVTVADTDLTARGKMKVRCITTGGLALNDEKRGSWIGT